ncbi:MAG: transglycosylase domain-containing protein [Clostridiales bacterium]|nr:transglycosylase domain-containing protein [Clostridiales bacterium]
MKRVLKTISLVFAALSITAVISIALLLEPSIKVFGFTQLDDNRLNNIKNTLVIYGNDGKSELSGTYYVPIEALNSFTVDAFLCAEDKRFFEHEGIDYSRIVAAMIKDLKDGAFSQGASTITQQLIKNTHLSNEKSIARKVQEVRLSRAIERKYSKDEILEMYLNILYFGSGTYGIGSAAHNFFGKTVKELTIKESAMLASIINNPAKYSPYDNMENLNKRTQLVLKLMKDNGKISAEQFNDALKENTSVKEMLLYDKYRCFVIKEACEILGCSEEFLLHNNIKIYCNCDFDLQNRIAEYLAPYEAECLQVAVIENKTGRIIAHEAKYQGDPSNIVRSPGSTIKPIVCYAPAIEKNIIVPITPILDQKTNFRDYSPSNYKDRYYGWVSCEYALKESLNIPAVKLLECVGTTYAKNFATDMGITVEDEGLALALGGMKYGTSLKTIAEAYSIFARGGSKIKCSYIKAIFSGGNLVYSTPQTTKKIMQEETAYLINEMLNECAKSGTAKRLNVTDFNWAAKTGTVGTEIGNSDAYCIVYSPDYTIGVHIMQDNGSITGGGLPTKIAKKLIMSDIICDKTFKMPAKIVQMDINALQYNKNQKIIAAEKNLPKKDRITASFPIYNLPSISDERSDYEKGLDFFDMDNFTIVDGFFD